MFEELSVVAAGGRGGGRERQQMRPAEETHSQSYEAHEGV